MDGVLVGTGSLWLLTQYWTCGGLFPVWVGVTYLLNKINKGTTSIPFTMNSSRIPFHKCSCVQLRPN